MKYEPRDPVELIKDHLPADVVLLVGKKSTAKSQMVAHWAACITDGKEFVPGVRPHITVSVVKHLEELGITRATWKRAQDALHKKGMLAYGIKGRTTSWKRVGTESESESGTAANSGGDSTS